MSEREPIPPEAMLGPSDWGDEDLLTVVEASDRLTDEVEATRQRIAIADDTFERDGSPAFNALHSANVAAERARLAALVEAAERIKAAQANAPG
jgi:hypothetical protein